MGNVSYAPRCMNDNTKTIYYFFAWKICLEWNDKIPSLKRYFSGEQNSNKKLNTFVWL